MNSMNVRTFPALSCMRTRLLNRSANDVCDMPTAPARSLTLASFCDLTDSHSRQPGTGLCRSRHEPDRPPRPRDRVVAFDSKADYGARAEDTRGDGVGHRFDFDRSGWH